MSLTELAVGVANADLTDPVWAKMRDHYAEVYALIMLTAAKAGLAVRSTLTRTTST